MLLRQLFYRAAESGDFPDAHNLQESCGLVQGSTGKPERNTVPGQLVSGGKEDFDSNKDRTNFYRKAYILWIYQRSHLSMDYKWLPVSLLLNGPVSQVFWEKKKIRQRVLCLILS